LAAEGDVVESSVLWLIVILAGGLIYSLARARSGQISLKSLEKNRMSGKHVETLPFSKCNATVPDRLIGCWRRRYIKFEDGRFDTETRVIWLQTASGAGDIRIAKGRPNLAFRNGFDGCTRDELLALAEQDCFAGKTVFDSEAKPFPTARWPVGSYDFRFQPVITFPEDGWMEWTENGTCMIERAPSGAYEEDWRLEPNSQTFAAHLTRDNADGKACLYVAGDHAVFAKNRKTTLPADRTILELASENSADEMRLRDLVDCEFSYARRQKPGGDYIVELSTLPWREGQVLDCAWVENIVHDETTAALYGSEPTTWTIESFWRG
jgi:hypothetical protein